MEAEKSSLENILSTLGIHEVKDMKEALATKLTKAQQESLRRRYQEISPENRDDFARRAMLDYPFENTALYRLSAEVPTVEKLYLGAERLPFLRAMGAWLSVNKDLLGSKILDAGCGCGILTLLAAALCPGAQVTGLNRVPEETALAAAFAEELGLANVTFETGDIRENRNETYDTVLCMDVLNENTHLDPDAVRYGGFREQIEASRENVQDFVSALCRLVGENGTLIACDPFPEVGTYYLGYLNALQENGLAPDLSCHTLLSVPGMSMPVTVSRRGEVPEEKKLFKAFRKIAFAKTADPEQYTRPQADWFLSRCGGKILQGFLSCMLLPDGREIAVEKHLLCGYLGNPDLVLYEETDPETFHLRVLPAEQTDAIENMLDSLEREARKQGLTTRHLPEDAPL